ncbi:hypothetical protein BROC_02286 [Candidatus Brocadiaceae bacterium]|nr:hypothetical protein BROC_02286 [Candidatus Brocadiaceae bacterium]
MPLPNLFLIGAMKAGTTTLYSWLSQHPHVFMSPIKEPHFFATDLWDVSSHIALGTEERVNNALSLIGSGLHNALIKDEKLYLKLFPKSVDQYQYIGEASPTYLRSRVAAQNIAKACPGAKIVILLRDPIDRAWSHYLMERNELRVPENFGILIQDEINNMNKGRLCQHGILESGLYASGILRYLDHFQMSDVLIADQCELRDRKAFVKKLNAFLGFEQDLFPSESDSANSSVAPRYLGLNRFLANTGIKQIIRSIFPQFLIENSKKIYYQKAPSPNEIDKQSKKILTEFYSEDIKKIVSMLGDNSPAWTLKYLR